MDNWVIGVDLGGTKIEIGLVDPQNRIAGHFRMPTNAADGPRSVVERIAKAVADLARLLPDGERITALGICCPGPVDHETGTLVDPPNLAGLHNAPLRQMLAERLNLLVCLEHDAKATALGEFYYGAGRGEQNMVYIVAGTGVGAAIIVDGKLFRGPYNSAGEVGHITLDRNGDLCSCGSKGCVETFIGGPWLAKRYQRSLGQAGQTVPSGTPLPITGETVAKLAGQGDPLAKRIMDEAGDALGTAVASMAMIVNIDLFVIGGSVAKAGDLLLEPARRALPQHAYRSVGCGVHIVGTELGDDGPILGCAWLARQTVGEFVQLPATTPRPERLIASEQARLEKVEGVVFDIQRFSVHDGPGIRTNVFLKGCSLRCPWCANPESQRLQPELSLSAQNCMVCSQFSEPCTVDWSQAGRDKYGERAALCPTGALRRVGERRTAGEVICEVLRDVPFYDGAGGLTLTGGEPTFQPKMAEALLRLAKAHDLTTAMETTGHTRWKILERLLPYLNHILYDVKHIDGEVHRAFTGVDNVIILANLQKLASLGAPVAIRVPLIPGFNADENSLGAIARWILEVDGLPKAVCLLPYHTLGRTKYKALGRAYPWEGYERLSEDTVDHLAQVMTSFGITVSLNGSG